MLSDLNDLNDKSDYISHRRNDGAEQSVSEHLCGTATLAHTFACEFGAENLAKVTALFHDIGKYSTEFQRRIRGQDIRVDHSTAGARELASNYTWGCGLKLNLEEKIKGERMSPPTWGCGLKQALKLLALAAVGHPLS